jgi:predicted thioesterase
MLSSLSRFRGVATVLPGKVRDLRQLLSVGDAIQATTPLLPTSNVASKSNDCFKTTILEQIERITAGLIERHAGANHGTAGFYVQVDEHKNASSKTECMFKAEVTEVTPSQAMFQVEVRDANNGALISSAVYSRVIVAAPYRFKL